MLAKVRRTIRRRALLARGERVLCGVSGGPDSSVLLHVMSRLAGELEVEVRAASVDHGLRADAAEDVAAARALADGLGVPFTALRVEVPRTGSIQANARRARYRALLDEAARLGASRLAVGHTLDDQAETVLMRLLRGSGLSGLPGVLPLRADGVIRPLIDCSREEVLAYAARHDIAFRDDPSNRDLRFERVRVRTAFLEAMRAEDPNVAAHLAQLADEARGLEEWASAIATERRARLDPETRLPLSFLEATPQPARKALLAQWIEGVSGRSAKRAHIEALLAGVPEVPLGGPWVAVLEEGAYVGREALDHRTRSRPSNSSVARRSGRDGDGETRSESGGLRRAPKATDR